MTLSNFFKLVDEFIPEFLTPIQNEALLISTNLKSDKFYDLCAEYFKEKSKKDKKEVFEFVYMIKDWIKPLLLFHNEADLNALKKIPLNEKCLRWLISWSDIKKEIDKINNSGLVYLPYGYALPFIIEYLHFKANLDITDRLIHFKKRSLRDYIVKEVDKHNKRKDYGRKRNTNNVNDIFLNLVLPLFQKQAEKFGMEGSDFLKKLFRPSKKNTMLEKMFLAGLLNEIFIIDLKAKKANILRLYFPLFKLLIKDLPLYSKEEFENLADDQVGKDGYKSYHDYQGRRVKSLLLSPM